MPIVSVSMPESLLAELDAFIDEHGYSGRSEAVREGARCLLSAFDERDFDGQTVVCVVTTVFDHESGVATRISELRHAHDELVTANVHSHAGESCLELFVVDGTVDEIGAYVARLRAVDEVAAVDHSIVIPTGHSTTPSGGVGYDEIGSDSDRPNLTGT